MAKISNLELARQYIEALELGDPDGHLAYFAADVVQQEWPNRLSPNGATRDLSALRQAAHRGRKVMSSQRYEVQSAIASRDVVAMEIHWTGTLAVPFDSVPVGGQLRARPGSFSRVPRRKDHPPAEL